MNVASKLHEKCKKCKYRENCNNKKMVACGLVGIQKPNTEPLTQPLSRKYTSVTINMGEYGNINTSLEQINNQINKAFQINCAFNKG